MPRHQRRSIPSPRVVVRPGHGGAISALNANDVLSGRGGRINSHPGNVAFRRVVEESKREYRDSGMRKLEKVHACARLVAQIRSTGGRFLKEHPERPGCYVEIGDQKAWKKAGQALREDAPILKKKINELMEADAPRVWNIDKVMDAPKGEEEEKATGIPLPQQYGCHDHQNYPQYYPPHGSGRHTNQPPDRGGPGQVPAMHFTVPQDGHVDEKPPSSPLLSQAVSSSRGPISSSHGTIFMV